MLLPNTESCMLTTIDNPYNPYVDYDCWLVYDNNKEYHTASLLSRLLPTNDTFTDEENDLLLLSIIDSIIDNDIEGIYMKVYPPSKPMPTMSVK